MNFNRRSNQLIHSQSLGSRNDNNNRRERENVNGEKKEG